MITIFLPIGSCLWSGSFWELSHMDTIQRWKCCRISLCRGCLEGYGVYVFVRSNSYGVTLHNLTQTCHNLTRNCQNLTRNCNPRYTQTLNDWEDRAIDAINEPNRPIPSGAITEAQVQVHFLLIYICNFHVLNHFLLIYICKLHWNQQQIYALWFAGIALAYGLDQWAGHPDLEILKLTLFGTFIAYIYSGNLNPNLG